MNRVQIIETITQKTGVSKTDASNVLNTLIETIQVAVKKGDTVTLVGFGTFKSAKRTARTGRNPANGEKIKIAATTVPRFTAGAKFKAVVDPKAAARKAAKKAK